MTDHQFYTIAQLAELLQVHENTIYRLVRAGKIEHYKVGAQIRISAAELERLKVERKSNQNQTHIMAAIKGQSVTRYVNSLIEQERKKNSDIYTAAKKLVDVINDDNL